MVGRGKGKGISIKRNRKIKFYMTSYRPSYIIVVQEKSDVMNEDVYKRQAFNNKKSGQG